MERADEPLERSSLQRNGISRAEPAEDVAFVDHPAMEDQARLDDAYTADFTVVRGAPARRGGAMRTRSTTSSPMTVSRKSTRVRGRGWRGSQGGRVPMKPAFLFVNNRLEGNAPSTIEAVAERLGS